MNNYDDRLYFELPDDYYALKNEQDDGTQLFVIAAGKTTNEKGEDNYKYNASVSEDNAEEEKNASSRFRIKGRFPASAECNYLETQILNRKLYLYQIWIRVSKDDSRYVIYSRRAVGDNEERDESLSGWILFLNSVLSCAVLDGERGDFDAFSMEDLLSVGRDVEAINAEESGMPFAKPAEGQHTHLDFLNKTKDSMSLLGNLIKVNQTGTEFSLQPVADMNSDNSDLDEIYSFIGSADQGSFELAETAGEMAKLFRVTREFFDSAHDREQEIYAGLIQRSAVYNSFRSFAWTLGAYCEKEKKKPGELSHAEISKIVEYIGKRNGLNYTENSFSPVICSGDDIHVLYIPDSVSAEIKEKLEKEIDEETGIRSLDGLRGELDYMYPAIRIIYDHLAASRDPEVPLTGPESDILYAWCSITHAAVQPIYSEDGPVNCWWEHPDEELIRKKQRLQQEIEQEEKWIQENRKNLTGIENISIRDKAYVFSGVEGYGYWEEIKKKFTEMGGIYRTAVSGKTDFLVCDPAICGESKLRNALEQRAKGKDVKIVLLGDFLYALGLKKPSRRDLLKQLEEEMTKDHRGPAKTSVVREEDTVSELPETFTYKQGLQAHGDGYVMDIPDGFVIKEGVEGRHFAAFIPNDESPDDYRESRFYILAGQRQDYEIIKNIATTAEYVALGKGFASGIAGFFKNDIVETYKRADLPGVILYGFEEGCAFINAIFGIDEHMQMMRMQAENIDITASAGYVKLVKDLFDHMRAEKPVKLLESPDGSAYLNMDLNGDTPDKWLTLIDDYINHLTIARNTAQQFLVEGFKKDQAAGNADIQKLKKNLKDMLREISSSADEVLEKAEKVFALKASQYPDHEKLFSMSEKVLNLADFADQYVNLGEQEIRVDSELAKEVRKRLEAVKEAKRKAEEEERKKQEQKRLEEERRLQEKKKREEEARKKEIDQYHIGYKNWENRCQEILNERKAFVEEKVSRRQKEIEEEARKEYDLAVESLKKELAEQEERESTAQARLSSLGMFKFTEKKEQKAIIEDAANRISAARDALMSKERELKNRLSAAPGEADKGTQKYNVEAIAELPLPEEPPKPAAVLYEEEKERERQRKKEEEERRRKELANMPTPDEQEALSWLGSYGTTADEVAGYMGVSRMKASALLSSLVVKGKAERYVERRVTYFKLKG